MSRNWKQEQFRRRRNQAFRPGLELLEGRMLLAIDLTGVEWRTIDGSNNNVAHPTQGAARTQQIRFGYGDRFPDDNGDVIITAPQRENPRTISNVIDAQTGSVPSQRLLTDWSFQWGQWVTHDMDLTDTGPQYNVLSDGTVGDFSIPVLDPNDPLGPHPISFNRSEYAAGTGANGVRRDVVNSVTSYIDASNVYGSDPTRTAALRTYQGGKLKTSSGGLLLPLNTAGLPNADQFGAGNQLFVAGDVRANEQIGLTTVHTLFVREHNRLATKIGQLNPQLNDEQIFQLARRLVGAEQQAITYKEYLPAVFGFDFAPHTEDAAYDSNVNAAITNSFAHAAFRFGHSEISDTTLLVNNFNQVVGNLSIRDAFFNPDILKNEPANVGRILKGLASQVGQEVDLQLVDGIRNNLFGPPGAGGLDLAALDIQRGRDHGLPDYNNLRGNYGLTPVDSFDDISSDPVIQQKLEQLYGNVNNIDAFVGALAEDHLPGTSAGPLLQGLIGNQFLRLRDGDRFFFTQDALLQTPQVKAVLDINQVTLAQVIRMNTGIQNLQDDVFFDRSVLVYHAPAAGGNVSLVTAGNTLSLIDNDRGQLLALRALSDISQVVLVGSNQSADVFNLFIAGANGGIEMGVTVYGGTSSGDRLNVYGRISQSDTFAVTGATISANTTTTSNSEVVLPRAVDALFVDVNGNKIFGTGFETLRFVTLGGSDTVSDPDFLALVVLAWNPFSHD